MRMGPTVYYINIYSISMKVSVPEYREMGEIATYAPPSTQNKCWEHWFIKIIVLLKRVSLTLASRGKCHRQGLLDIVCLADVKMQLKDCKTQIFRR